MDTPQPIQSNVSLAIESTQSLRASCETRPSRPLCRADRGHALGAQFGAHESPQHGEYPASRSISARSGRPVGGDRLRAGGKREGASRPSSEHAIHPNTCRPPAFARTSRRARLWRLQRVEPASTSGTPFAALAGPLGCAPLPSMIGPPSGEYV